MAQYGFFYTDTFFATVQTISGKEMAQIYTNDIRFVKTNPMSSKSETTETLLSFIHHISIPASIHSDYSKEIKHRKFQKLCQGYHIPITTIELYSPWQNRAEWAIWALKWHMQRKMHSCNVPQAYGIFTAIGLVIADQRPYINHMN